MYEVFQPIIHELIGTNLSGQDQLRLRVTGHSMAPFLRPGDYVLVKSVPFELIHCGDILVTQRVDGYLTHRFVGIDENGWITKGDRNRRADAPVRTQEIVGLVVAFERRKKLYSLGTRRRRIMTRLQGWSGWQEISRHSMLGIWSARIISRVLLFLSR
jgi:signal peptidase I